MANSQAAGISGPEYDQIDGLRSGLKDCITLLVEVQNTAQLIDQRQRLLDTVNGRLELCEREIALATERDELRYKLPELRRIRAEYEKILVELEGRIAAMKGIGAPTNEAARIHYYNELGLMAREARKRSGQPTTRPRNNNRFAFRLPGDEYAPIAKDVDHEDGAQVSVERLRKGGQRLRLGGYE